MDQTAVIDFLTDPASHGAPVQVIETHASIIILLPDKAYKMKKAVTYPYLDYGTLERRRQFCFEEVRINRRTAPDLYLDPVPVTRDQNGLTLDGKGVAVEWLIPMRRFNSEFLLDRLAEAGDLSPALCRDIADAIHDFHVSAKVLRELDAVAELRKVVETIIAELRRHEFPSDRVDHLTAQWRRMLSESEALIEQRVEDGYLRHLHGDLHLRNIVLWQGRVTLFDAIEFDPAIAEIDTLYDLSFLLMDLLHRNQKPAANAILNRYLQRSGDYGCLPLLPLFLSIRSGIRAHTTASSVRSQGPHKEALAYLDLARSVLERSDYRALAIGGPSGSGKSTVSAHAAPQIGGAIGAMIIRSDVIRKRLNGKAPEEKLPEAAYSGEVSQQVFETIAEEVECALAAGQSIIVDAVLGKPVDREPIATAIESHGTGLQGFWLQAPASILRQRVRTRTNDASDADVAVLTEQLPSLQQPSDWQSIDASGTPEETIAELMRHLNRQASVRQYCR